MHLTLRIPAGDALYRADVSKIHGKQQIEIFIILHAQLLSGFPIAVDAMLFQLLAGGRVYGAADLRRAGAAGFDVELPAQAQFEHQVLEDKFRHGAAADVAKADEENTMHAFHSQKSWYSIAIQYAPDGSHEKP